MSRTEHHPQCDKPGTPADRCKVCGYIEVGYAAGYTAGYNDRARSAAHSTAMYGIPERATQHGPGENP